MSVLSPGMVLDRLFAEGRWTAARRIEVRRGYASDVVDPRWSHWARGGRLLPEPDRPWYVRVRGWCAAGRVVERVRVIDSPASIGQRYLRAIAPNNVEAGERIRLLPRGSAEALGLDADVWLFEGEDPRVAVLRFSDGDVLTGVEVSRVAKDVAAGRARWAAAWPVARDLVE